MEELATFRIDSNSQLPTASPSLPIYASKQQLKQLFQLPYQPTLFSLRIRRHANSLVLDPLSESQRIRRRYKNKSQFLVDMDPPHPQVDRDEETGEIFVMVSTPVQDNVQAYMKIVYEKFLYHRLSRERLLTASGHGPIIPETTCTRLYGTPWKFQHMELGIVQDTLVFENTATTEDTTWTSMVFQDVEESWNGLDRWLDNIMANVTQTAICFHKDGHVHGYQAIQTSDIPYIVSTDAGFVKLDKQQIQFDPEEVQQRANTILQFLQRHCTEEDGTYWLTRDPDDLNVLHLYQVPTTTNASNPALDIPMGMLSFRMAENQRQSFQRYFQRHQGIPSDQLIQCRRLYLKSAELLENEPEHEHVALQSYCALSESYVMSYIPLPVHLSLLIQENVQRLYRKERDDLSFQEFQDNNTSWLAYLAIPETPSELDLAKVPPLDEEEQRMEDYECSFNYLSKAWKHRSIADKLQLRLLKNRSKHLLYVMAIHAIQKQQFIRALQCTLQAIQYHGPSSKHHIHLIALLALVHMCLAKQPTKYENNDDFVGKVPRQVEWCSASIVPDGMDSEKHWRLCVKYFMQAIKLHGKRNHDIFDVELESLEVVQIECRRALKEAYAAMTQYFVATGRYTKAAQYATQGYSLFHAIQDPSTVLRLHCLQGEISFHQACWYEKKSSEYRLCEIAYQKAFSCFRQLHERLPSIEIELKHRLDRLSMLLHTKYAFFIESSSKLHKELVAEQMIQHFHHALNYCRSPLEKSQVYLHLSACFWTQKEPMKALDAIEYAFNALEVNVSSCISLVMLRLEVGKRMLQFECTETTWNAFVRSLLHLIRCHTLFAVVMSNTSTKSYGLMMGMVGIVYKLIGDLFKAMLRCNSSEHLKDAFRYFLQHQQPIAITTDLHELEQRIRKNSLFRN